MERAYERASTLLSAADKAAIEAFLDSVRLEADQDNETRILYQLLLARSTRYEGRFREAFETLDSIRFDTALVSPMLSYSLFAQKAKIFKTMESFAEARRSALVAQKLASRLHDHVYSSNMQILLAEIDLHRGDYVAAYDAFNEALIQARALPDERLESKAELGIGNVFYHQERDSLAVVHYRKAMAAAASSGSSGHFLDAAMNAGAAMAYTQGPQASIILYDSLVKNPILQQDAGALADLLMNKASFHSELGQDESAVKILEEVLALLHGSGDAESEAHCRLFLANSRWAIGQKEEAINSVLIADKLAVSLSLRAETNAKLAEYFSKTGRHVEAFARLGNYSNMRDSLMRMRFDDRMAQSEVKHETAEKERLIAEQEQALALAAAEDRRKSIQRNALIGATALLVLIALLLYRAMRSRQRLAQKEKDLHDKQVDQLLSQQELKSINAMLEGQEKERDRMGKDLHDRLGSMLGGIKANMAAIEDRVEQMRQDQQYQKVNKLLDQTVSELRQISHDMAAATLSRFGLEKALKDLRDTIHISGRLHVELNTFGLDQRLERSVEIAVYRIIQELVSNVLKHAKASELTIGVTRAPGRLSVLVSDNGIGFEPSSASGGMGLGNVRSRATAIGATVQVDSAPGKGTTVSVECPVVE